MAINVDTLRVKIGGESSELVRALQTATEKIQSWATGLVGNMSRRIRSYVERFIAVGIVTGILRMVRNLAQSFEDAQEKAASLGISTYELFSIRKLGSDFGIASEKVDTIAEAFMKAAKNATNLRDAIGEVTKGLKGMPIDRIQAEILVRTGQYLPQDFARELIYGQVKKDVSEEDAAAFFAKSVWDEYKNIWRSFFTKLLASAKTRAMFQGNLEASLEEEDRVRRIAEQIKERQKRQEIQSKLNELAVDRIEFELQLAAVDNDFAKQERIIKSKMLGIQRAMMDVAQKNDPVKLEELKVKLMKEEVELRKVRAEREKKRKELEERYAKEAKRISDGIADAEKKLADLKLMPSLEDVMRARVRGRPTPQALAAREALWLKELVPWLRARGAFAQAEALEQRFWTIKDRLAAAGFIKREETPQAILKELEASRSELSKLRDMAARDGIKIKPELAQ